jgi:hypothetical protein
MSLWYRRDADPGNGDYGILAGKNGTGGDGPDAYYLRHLASTDANNPGSVEFVILDSLNAPLPLFSPSAFPTDGGWHHIAATYEPNTAMRLYIDGVEVSNLTTGVYSSIVTKPNTSFTIGNLAVLSNVTTTGLSREINGGIDDVQLYSEALTAGQVAFLYDNAGLAVPEPASALMAIVAFAGLGLIGGRSGARRTVRRRCALQS